MPFTKDDVSLYRSVNGIKVPLTNMERQVLADEWNKNELDAILERTRINLETKKLLALQSLQLKVLEAALIDPNAPQEVKDYAELLRTTGK